jgi:hypothetical protein
MPAADDGESGHDGGGTASISGRWYYPTSTSAFAPLASSTTSAVISS